MDKEYNHKEVEKKWIEKWSKSDIYSFKNDGREVFSIDTPPPYTSGVAHMGTILGYVWFDMIARFKRMRGFDVYFPHGWDTQGLPTELKVEKELGKSAKKDRSKFREACKKWTEYSIERMSRQLKSVGYFPDWNNVYVTMDRDYWRRVQYSLLKFHEKGLIYIKEHPVHFCPSCESAIAKAEINYREEEGYLNYIKFKLEDGETIEIATTRPELLPACVAVAVNPEDDRYKDLPGRKAIVPIFNQKVEIFSDRAVDPEFGTGIVMICTFGDEQDVKWAYERGLPVVKAINQRGKLTKVAGKYKGMGILEAREAIISDLEKQGYLVKREKIVHQVAVHDKCGTPIEFVPTLQWFIKVRQFKEDIIGAAMSMKWIPDYMLQRLIDWAESLDWDWVISRQRIWGTPIPFWYCEKCHYIIAPREEELPLDPTEREPPVKECPSCGSRRISPARDVCDCWVDSSITPLVITGWPNEREKFEKLYPVSIRPQGYEIIRTWAFYTIFRCLMLTGKPPFKEIVINGMVLGDDGRKMSKSYGNVVEPDEVVEKYGGDSLRQWVSTGALGKDVPFSWKEVKHGHKFLRKLWNIARFVKQNTSDYDGSEYDVSELKPIDRWILYHLDQLIESTTNDFERYEFPQIMRRIWSFTWNKLADDYLEIVKHRIYDPKSIEEKRKTQFVLLKVLRDLVKLVAPITPFIAEEIYQEIDGRKESVHIEEWPERIGSWLEEGAEVSVLIIRGIRRYKGEKGIPLNRKLKEVEIFVNDQRLLGEIRRNLEDIEGATRSEILIREGVPEIDVVVKELEPDISKIGPEFKEKTKDVIEQMRKIKSEIGEEKLYKSLLNSGIIELKLESGETVNVSERHLKIRIERRVGDKEIVEVGDPRVKVLVKP